MGLVEFVEPHARLLSSAADIDRLPIVIEYMARYSHKTQEKQKGDRDSAIRFVRARIAQRHDSVLEHGTIRFEAVLSKPAAIHLIRHRLISLTEASLRYTVAKIPVLFIKPPSFEAHEDILQITAANSVLAYQEALKQGIPPEDARYLLSFGVATIMGVTVNIRELRHIFTMRLYNKRAQWEIRQVFASLRQELEAYGASWIFDDLEETEQ